MRPGTLLIVAGLVLVAAGVLFLAGERIGLGRLPGDLAFRRGNLRLYVPLASGLLVSLVLTLLLNLFLRR